MFNINIYPVLIALLIGVFAGIFLEQKVFSRKVEYPKCPDCNCPAAVSLDNFELEKLNNKKGNFTYSPQISNVKIVIENKDSVLLKTLLKKAK